MNKSKAKDKKKNDNKPGEVLPAPEKVNIGCDICAFAVSTVDARNTPVLECHRFPPSVSLIVVSAAIMGQRDQTLKQSAFPNCSYPCGEFIPMPEVSVEAQPPLETPEEPKPGTKGYDAKKQK